MSDRKYRQSGYQDDGDADRRSQNRPRGQPNEGPRGRGLGAPTASVLKCSRCGAKVSSLPSPGDLCRSCGSDLHTCTNCRHFDTSAPNECRQPVEVRVAAKAKGNDCSHFEPKVVQEFAADSSSSGTATDAKAAFDDLFNF
ncbi:MAG: hypothetical protein GY769_25725 [bacterium]|nr:hypothetical protein [bacterium]